MRKFILQFIGLNAWAQTTCNFGNLGHCIGPFLNQLGFNKNQANGIPPTLETPRNISLARLTELADKSICLNQCCRDLKELFENGIFENLDFSGTFRQSGLFLGDLIADGYYDACKNIGNYCKLSTGPRNEGVPAPAIFHCVPKSCDVRSLNQFLRSSKFINDLDILDTSDWKYKTCYDRSYLNASYEWYVIAGYVTVAVWAIFLIFSPFEKLNARQIISELFSNHQSQSSLKSLHGLRVISLIWVITGHTFLLGFFVYARNPFELLEYLGYEYPNTIWLAAGEVSVDSFFCIGGLLTGYLMTKTAMKMQGFPFKNVILATINRTLRINFTVLAAIFIAVTIYSHQGDTDFAHRSKPAGFSILMGSAATLGELCQDNWYYTFLNIMVFTIDMNHWCMAWHSEKNGRKIGK